MSYTEGEAIVPLFPPWLNLDSCSLIRLATLVMSLSLAIYLLSREGKSKATLFLGLMFCGAVLFNISSLLEFAGLYYWQPRNLKNLLVPLLQDIGPSIVLIALILFAYFFPRLPGALKKEFQTVLSITLFVNAVVLALTIYNFTFLERGQSYFRFTRVYYTILYSSLGAQLLLVVILLLRRTVVISAGKSRTWWARLWKPQGMEARTARSLALILLLLVAAICGYALMTYGFIPLPIATYFIWLAFLLFYFSFVVTYLNHTAEPSSFQVKLVGLTLIPVLGLLGLVAIFVGQSTETDFTNRDRLPDSKTILFAPNRRSGYDIRESPYRLDTDLGGHLDIKYGGSRSVELGFVFPFFDRAYRVIQVLHSPMIYLGDIIEEDGWGGYQPNSAIAPLLMNLDPAAGKGIFLKREPDALTVTWYQLPELGFTNANTVQLVLHGDGSFSMCFAGLDPQGRYPAVQMYNFTTAATTGRHPGSLGKAVAFGPKLTGIHPGTADAPLRPIRLDVDLPYSGTGREVIFESYESSYFHYLHYRMSVLALILIVSSLFIIFFFPILFRTNLIRPLRALSEGVRKADGGDLDAFVAPQYHDEIGFLTRSFNRMLESIKKAEANFWMLAENAQDGILIRRRNVTVYANRRATEITGYRKQELTGIDFPKLVAAGSFPQATAGEANPVEILLASKAGPGVLVELTCSQTGWHGQTADVVIIRDITERKASEEKARLKHQHLMQMDKLTSLGVLVAGMAHEINNPNQTILSNASLLQRAGPGIHALLEECRKESSGFLIAGMEAEEFRKSFPRLLADIESCSKRIDGIIKNLRSFSREDPFPVMTSLEVNPVIQAGIDLVSGSIKRATEHFSLALQTGLPRVKGNAQRLEQVIINLLLNACQALPDRSKAVSVSSRLEPDGKSIRIEIRDEGIGIPPEQLPRLGEPFFTTRRAAGGTGLGLYVSEAIVAEHQGCLSFASQQGKGTVVALLLPMEMQS
jgi:PAS domain S-box-containing protein